MGKKLTPFERERRRTKRQLWKMMTGTGGPGEVFDALGEIARELAQEHRDVRENEVKAKAWDAVARAMGSLQAKAAQLIELHP
jgi:hypothetical protein